MNKFIYASIAFVAGALCFYILLNSPYVLHTESSQDYPSVYVLFEDGTQSNVAPQLLQHKLEIISDDTFLYSTDGHMTYDRVRGEIIRKDDSYDFVVTEPFKGRFEEGDSLFSSQSVGKDAMLVEWHKAQPLQVENDTFRKSN